MHRRIARKARVQALGNNGLCMGTMAMACPETLPTYGTTSNTTQDEPLLCVVSEDELFARSLQIGV